VRHEENSRKMEERKEEGKEEHRKYILAVRVNLEVRK
jgi:hypothetical protein